MERYDFKTQRLFTLHHLCEEAVIEADRGQANYLLNVLRLKANSKVLLFNGKDGEWLCDIEPVGRKACNLKVEKQTRLQPQPYDLVYCFAPLKTARLEYMIQKAVEMGAGTLQPVITHHTQNTKLNLERVRSYAQEAAEQCGILNIPNCNEPLKLPQLIDAWDVSRTLIFADESAEEENPLKTLSTLKPDQKKALIIGPEGGFSPNERKLLLSKDFVLPIALGPRILRADTAAVAALSVIQSACGDW